MTALPVHRHIHRRLDRSVSHQFLLHFHRSPGLVQPRTVRVAECVPPNPPSFLRRGACRVDSNPLAVGCGFARDETDVFLFRSAKSPQYGAPALHLLCGRSLCYQPGNYQINHSNSAFVSNENKRLVQSQIVAGSDASVSLEEIPLRLASFVLARTTVSPKAGTPI